MFFWVFCTIYF